MKKYANFRLEPIRLRNNKEAPTVEFQQALLPQMIDVKKKTIARLKKEENEKIVRINSKFLSLCMKPYEEETRHTKPNIQMLKQKEMLIQQNRSRNQDDSNDDQGSILSSKTQTVSEYRMRPVKNPLSSSKVPKRKYITSIVHNEHKQPFILPLSYRKNIFIEGIEEENYYESSLIEKKQSIKSNGNINNNNSNKVTINSNMIKVIPEEKRKPSFKDIYYSKDRNIKPNYGKEKKTSLTNSIANKEHKLKLHKIKIVQPEKKVKVILSKRDIPPFISTTQAQLANYHNYNLIPLISSPYSPSPLNQLQQGQRISLSKSLTIDQTYYYTINKSYKIQFENYFSHRTNWVMVNKQAKQINFQWKYFCKNVDFRKCIFDPVQPLKKQMMVNLFENNTEIGNKKNLFLNLIKYCTKININVFEIIPFTVVISNGKSFDQTMEALDEIMTFINTYSSSSASISKSSTPTVNDSDSKGLYFNKLYKDHFPNDNLIANDDKTIMYIANPFLSQKNYWILKPVDLYKGMGIQLSNNLSEMKKLSKKILIGVDTTFKKEAPATITTSTNANANVNIIANAINSSGNKDNNEQSQPKEDDPNANGNRKAKNISHIYCSSQILIQKYLDNPLLYNKRKFDIRCYVLVDHNFNVYYCKEGHLKGCSVEYDIETKSPFAHITNHSFQKHSENFQKYEFGNEMSYQNFKDFLQEEGISLELFDKMIQKMKYSIEVSMNAVGAKLNKKERMLSFEIFGYDFIIDNHFTPWILEINNNPGLGISSPVIEKLVPRMLDDAFRLTIDTYFETKYDAVVIDQNTQLYKSKFSLDGYSDSENIFEFLCNIDRLP